MSLKIQNDALLKKCSNVFKLTQIKRKSDLDKLYEFLKIKYTWKKDFQYVIREIHIKDKLKDKIINVNKCGYFMNDLTNLYFVISLQLVLNSLKTGV